MAIDRLSISQAVQRIANRLVEDSLASFEPNPDHMTSPIVALTAKGEATLRAINQAAARRNIRTASALGYATVKELSAQLTELSQALADDANAEDSPGSRRG